MERQQQATALGKTIHCTTGKPDGSVGSVRSLSESVRCCELGKGKVR
jgi:hypothetical protein